MDGASGTSRCAVATKLNTLLINALIWLPACTSGGTAGYQELTQAQCNPPCCIRGGNKTFESTIKSEDEGFPQLPGF